MRKVLMVLAVVGVAGFVVACSKTGKAPAGKQAGAGPLVIKVGDKDVLTLTVPAGAKTYDDDGKYTFVTPEGNGRFYLWPVQDANSLDAAKARIPEVISSEFKDFKEVSTMDSSVAGMGAKVVTGKGTEADDGDAGQATVTLVKIGDHVFAACTHGEAVAAEALKKFEMEVLGSAKAP